VLAAAASPVARVFLGRDDLTTVSALRDTIVAFAPGLLGYGLVALLTRALYARGLWKAPTCCVVGGWLVAVAADVVLSGVLPSADRGAALALGHTLGVTVAGAGLVVVVARVAGRAALSGLPRAGAAAVAAGLLGAVAGVLVGRLLGVDPQPPEGIVVALGSGVVIAGTVLLVAGAVMMGTARGPLRAAVRALRTAERQEVSGG
jgi:putative peptidoglycan lipid II flippase